MGRSRMHRVAVAAGLSAVVLFSAVGLQAQQEEEEEAIQALRAGLDSVLTDQERRGYEGWPSKWSPRAPAVTAGPAGEEVAHKVVDARRAAAPVAAPFALADQALHAFLVDALVGARRGAIAQQVRSIPPIRDAASARAARARLTRLVRLAGPASPAVEATIQMLTATTARNAPVATAQALSRVVQATLAAGAPRAAVVTRAVALAKGTFPAFADGRRTLLAPSGGAAIRAR